jgi:hypothetical protein
MVYNTNAESTMPSIQQQPWNLQPNAQRCSSSSSYASSDSDGCSSSSDDCSSCGCAEPLSMAKPLSGIPTSIFCDAEEGADYLYYKSVCYDANDAVLPTMSAADVMNAAMSGSRSCSNDKNSSRSRFSASYLLRAGGIILVALVLASAAYSRHSLESRAGLKLSEQNSFSQDLLVVAERDAHAMQRDHTSLQAANDQLLSELSR